MSLNNDPNSDSKKCTVSKIGYAQCTHLRSRLRAHSAVSQRAQRRVAAPTTPCRALGVLSQRRITCWAPCSSTVFCALGVVLQRRVTTQKAAPFRDTKIVSRHHCGKDVSARCRSPLRVGWPCRAPCRNALLRAPARRPGLCLACRDTILLYGDQSSKMGSSPSNFSPAHCFSFVLLTVKPQFFFSNFLVEPKKNYYNFFPVLHTVKPLEKKIFSIYIYIFYSSSSFPATCKMQ